MNFGDRVHYFKALLHEYLQACEYKYDVQVIVVIDHKNPRFHHFLHILNSTEFYCTRLHHFLPISYVHPYKEHMANTYRNIFYDQANNYDLFIYQEDDAIIKPYVLDYYLDYRDFFKGTKFVPAFDDFEILYDKNSLSESNKPTFQLIQFFDIFFNYQLIRYRGEYFYGHYAPRHPYVFLTQKDLMLFKEKEFWFGHYARAKFHEINVDLIPRWLNRHYFEMRPLRHFFASFTHHASDKYTNLGWKEYHKANHSEHNSLVSIDELYSLLKSIVLKSNLEKNEDFLDPTKVSHLGKNSHFEALYTKILPVGWDIVKNHFHYATQFDSLDIAKIHDCIESGKVVDFKASFLGEFHLNNPNTIFNISDLKCLDSIPMQLNRLTF